MNKRKRKNFKSFDFENPTIGYNSEQFDKLKTALEKSDTKTKGLLKSLEEQITTAEEHLANLHKPNVKEELAKLRPEVIKAASDWLGGLNKKGAHSIIEEMANKRLTADGPESLFYQYVCYQLEIEYDDLILVAEPSIDNIVTFAIEDATDTIKEALERKDYLNNIIEEIDADRVSLENLAKYAKDPERTDLNYLVDIPKAFRTDVLEQLDHQLMHEQAEFETHMERYKYEKRDLQDMKNSLKGLPPFKLKIAKVKIANKTEQLNSARNTLKEYKSYLEMLTEKRNYFGALIESLPE